VPARQFCTLLGLVVTLWLKLRADEASVLLRGGMTALLVAINISAVAMGLVMTYYDVRDEIRAKRSRLPTVPTTSISTTLRSITSRASMVVRPLGAIRPSFVSRSPSPPLSDVLQGSVMVTNPLYDHGNGSASPDPSAAVQAETPPATASAVPDVQAHDQISVSAGLTPKTASGDVESRVNPLFAPRGDSVTPSGGRDAPFQRSPSVSILIDSSGGSVGAAEIATSPRLASLEE
jgi:hypothetical protein